MPKADDIWDKADAEERFKELFRDSRGFPPSWLASMQAVVEAVKNGEIPDEFHLSLLLQTPQLIGLAATIAQIRREIEAADGK